MQEFIYLLHLEQEIGILLFISAHLKAA